MAPAKRNNSGRRSGTAQQKSRKVIYTTKAIESAKEG